MVEAQSTVERREHWMALEGGRDGSPSKTAQRSRFAAIGACIPAPVLTTAELMASGVRDSSSAASSCTAAVVAGCNAAAVVSRRSYSAACGLPTCCTSDLGGLDMAASAARP
ncbi:MAG TPA: hypothetical protein VMT10_05880 [Solirubrobacteraceae bacterium]|nr:hypothetical protein [Solirubrobacteraceae bacterium]